MYIIKYCEINGFIRKKFLFCYYGVRVVEFFGLFVDFLNYMCCLCYCSVRIRWYSLEVFFLCS